MSSWTKTGSYRHEAEHEGKRFAIDLDKPTDRYVIFVDNVPYTAQEGDSERVATVNTARNSTKQDIRIHHDGRVLFYDLRECKGFCFKDEVASTPRPSRGSGEQSPTRISTKTVSYQEKWDTMSAFRDFCEKFKKGEDLSEKFQWSKDEKTVGDQTWPVWRSTLYTPEYGQIELEIYVLVGGGRFPEGVYVVEAYAYKDALEDWEALRWTRNFELVRDALKTSLGLEVTEKDLQVKGDGVQPPSDSPDVD